MKNLKGPHTMVPADEVKRYSDQQTSVMGESHATPSPACSVFISRSLVTALNNGDSSASVLMSLLSGEYPTNELST
jgi:hypothetical protein